MFQPKMATELFIAYLGCILIILYKYLKWLPRMLLTVLSNLPSGSDAYYGIAELWYILIKSALTILLCGGLACYPAPWMRICRVESKEKNEVIFLKSEFLKIGIYSCFLSTALFFPYQEKMRHSEPHHFFIVFSLMCGNSNLKYRCESLLEFHIYNC